MTTEAIIIGLLLVFWPVIPLAIIIIRDKIKGGKKPDRNDKNNYGYPYLGFNNPFMDGFE